MIGMKETIIKLAALLSMPPLSALASEKCNATGMYQIVDSTAECPAGYKYLGEVHDSCPSWLKEYGAIDTLGYVQSGSDGKGGYTCK
jgi:hypothetical protein